MPVCVENNFLVLRRSQERKCQKQTVPHSVDDSLDILLGLTKFCEIEILKAANFLLFIEVENFFHVSLNFSIINISKEHVSALHSCNH